MCERIFIIRGNPSLVILDCGTNSVAPEKKLRDMVLALDQDKITSNGTSSGIRQQFNPAYGYH